jgi:hypothetical protein
MENNAPLISTESGGRKSFGNRVWIAANSISCIPVIPFIGSLFWSDSWGGTSVALYGGSTEVLLLSFVAILACLAGWLLYFIISFCTKWKVRAHPFGFYVLIISLFAFPMWDSFIYDNGEASFNTSTEAH